MREHLGLEIKPSELPIEGVGLGLFTTVERRRGDDITLYKGDLHTEPFQGPYALQVRKNPLLIIDASATTSCQGRYVNSAKGTNKTNNTQFVWSARTGHAWIRATKKILPGTELLIAYGAGFWKKPKAARARPGSRLQPIDLTD
jgi:hypothetical protein